jgi:hypothetical protein
MLLILHEIGSSARGLLAMMIIPDFTFLVLILVVWIGLIWQLKPAHAFDRVFGRNEHAAESGSSNFPRLFRTNVGIFKKTEAAERAGTIFYALCPFDVHEGQCRNVTCALSLPQTTFGQMNSRAYRWRQITGQSNSRPQYIKINSKTKNLCFSFSNIYVNNIYRDWLVCFDIFRKPNMPYPESGAISNMKAKEIYGVLFFSDIGLPTRYQNLPLSQFRRFSQFCRLFLFCVTQAGSRTSETRGSTNQENGNANQSDSEGQNANSSQRFNRNVVSFRPRIDCEKEGRVIVYGGIGLLVLGCGFVLCAWRMSR